MFPPHAEVPQGVKQASEFARFVEQNYPLLVGFLRKRLGSIEDAKDIAQESFARLLRYSDQPAGALRPLLFRIATNVVTDWKRRNRGECVGAWKGVDMELIIDDLASEDFSPDEILQSQQELAMVRAAILRLPEHCRHIYLLNRMDGLTYAQIAQKYNLSLKAIEKQMSKALSLINHHLKVNGAERGQPE
ncbi:RNA polymerase sigma factor [Stenotrophomonas maltophilia]|uniref:RNA polymerase sigma factor n=1 Tax=Stenotrophomonas maltophilia TaxID=40324 RepID=UPI0009BF9660|nr:sigma-70 family RNA polymerase sigma factor [Stenotrophomonas maltophilia]